MQLTEKQKHEIEEAFRGYVRAYDLEDPKIRLKADHSFRVAALSETIAVSAMEAASADLAWLTGLLHDIGRFEQVRRYGTFVDARSVDHAALSADLLFREDLLQRFTDAPDPAVRINADARETMEISIREHNKYRIREDLPLHQKTCCDILRDADKIDIFRVLCDTPVEEIYNVTTEELRTAEVTEEVRECFRRHITVPRNLRKTPIDSVVGYICMFYELVYPVSREIALRQGYFDRLLRFRSDNLQTQQWFEYMRSTLNKK